MKYVETKFLGLDIYLLFVCNIALVSDTNSIALVEVNPNALFPFPVTRTLLLPACIIHQGNKLSVRLIEPHFLHSQPHFLPVLHNWPLHGFCLSLYWHSSPPFWPIASLFPFYILYPEKCSTKKLSRHWLYSLAEQHFLLFIKNILN